MLFSDIVEGQEEKRISWISADRRTNKTASKQQKIQVIEGCDL